MASADRARSARPVEVRLRPAVAADAHAIGAVFDAAVRAGWTFLGELAQRPMFAAQHWDELVGDHAPPRGLIVATDDSERAAGLTEAFLCTEEQRPCPGGVPRRRLPPGRHVRESDLRT